MTAASDLPGDALVFVELIAEGERTELKILVQPVDERLLAKLVKLEACKTAHY